MLKVAAPPPCRRARASYEKRARSSPHRPPRGARAAAAPPGPTLTPSPRPAHGEVRAHSHTHMQHTRATRVCTLATRVCTRGTHKHMCLCMRMHMTTRACRHTSAPARLRPRRPDCPPTHHQHHYTHAHTRAHTRTHSFVPDPISRRPPNNLPTTSQQSPDDLPAGSRHPRLTARVADVTETHRAVVGKPGLCGSTCRRRSLTLPPPP